MNDLDGTSAVSIDLVADTILVLRGQRVMLDADLARLYGVTTARLNQQVRRNAQRFPADFAFQLTDEEYGNLMLQNATSSWGGRRKPPMAFTEHGAVMAASVLNTPRAVEVSVYVVRAFIQLREILSTRTEVARKMEELEHRLDGHDEQIEVILEAIRALMALPEPSERRIGFRTEETDN
jgi:hypothetical protein